MIVSLSLHGQLCKDPSRYYNNHRRECVSCGDVRYQEWPLVGMGMAAAALIGTAVATYRAPGLKVYAMRISFRAKMRIILSFLQIITQIPSVYEVNFPDSYESLLEVFSLVNFGLFGWIPNLRLFCIGVSSLSARLHFANWVPLGVAALAVGTIELAVVGREGADAARV